MCRNEGISQKTPLKILDVSLGYCEKCRCLLLGVFETNCKIHLDSCKSMDLNLYVFAYLRKFSDYCLQFSILVTELLFHH